MGRRISELEEPLRQQLFSVKGTLGDFVCDECLLELQPLPRTDTLWAAERPDRVKLCASNGWACAKQLENETVRFCHKAGTPRGYTDPLRKLPDCVSAYKRRQMGIVDYAKPLLCHRCFMDAYNANARANDTESTPLSKKQRTDKEETKPVPAAPGDDALRLLAALRQFPSGLQCRIAAVAGHLEPEVTAPRVAAVLGLDSHHGTLWRSIRLLKDGVSPEELFRSTFRGTSVDREKVIRKVVDFLKLMSVPANDGRLLKRYPGEQRRYLEDPLIRVVLPAFRRAYPDMNMSAGRFSSIRRKHASFIAPRHLTPHAGCWYCNNLRFRVEALREHQQSLECSSVFTFPVRAEV